MSLTLDVCHIFQEMKLSPTKVHNQQLGFTDLYLCYLGRLSDRSHMHLDGARTSIPEILQHFITLDHLLLPCILTAKERMVVVVEGRNFYPNKNSKFILSYLEMHSLTGSITIKFKIQVTF